MPQKIDINGLFLDPETITDLSLQKRISVYYPVFHEIPKPKSLFKRLASDKQHILQFDHHEPYGLILADIEQPETSGYTVIYKVPISNKMIVAAGKNVIGHALEKLKIDISGDRQYRILQPGRNVKKLTIREIPAKVQLLSGQWVDVFKSSPDYDFQGGTPYAITDVSSNVLLITTSDKKKVTYYSLYGGGVDASDEAVLTAYKTLTEVFNEIQARRDAATTKSSEKMLDGKSEKSLPHPKAALPKIALPRIKLQLPFVVDKKPDETTSETLPEPVPEIKSEDYTADQ